jgi:hypothetical protein
MPLSELIELCKRLDIHFEKPEYLVIDASDAEHNAAKNVFGENCTVLMCWYHLMASIRKPDNRKLIPAEFYDEVFICFVAKIYDIERY